MNPDDADRLEALLDTLGLGRPVWQAQAACRSHDVAVFFPERGDSAAPALRVCATCPVQTQCHDFAIANNDRDGIWGGASGRQRRAERGGHELLATHCGQGHPLDEANTFHDRRGSRWCKTCKADKQRARDERRSA